MDYKHMRKNSVSKGDRRDGNDFKPRFSSNSDVFARRGDPLVSQKEGLSDYGRREDEDPENDQYVALTRMEAKRQRETAERMFRNLASDLREGKLVESKTQPKNPLKSIVEKMRMRMIEAKLEKERNGK